MKPLKAPLILALLTTGVATVGHAQDQSNAIEIRAGIGQGSLSVSSVDTANIDFSVKYAVTNLISIRGEVAHNVPDTPPDGGFSAIEGSITTSTLAAHYNLNLSVLSAEAFVGFQNANLTEKLTPISPGPIIRRESSDAGWIVGLETERSFLDEVLTFYGRYTALTYEEDEYEFGNFLDFGGVIALPIETVESGVLFNYRMFDNDSNDYNWVVGLQATL